MMHSSWLTCGCMTMHGWLKWPAFGSGHYAFDAVYVHVDLELWLMLSGMLGWMAMLK